MIKNNIKKLFILFIFSLISFSNVKAQNIGLSESGFPQCNKTCDEYTNDVFCNVEISGYEEKGVNRTVNDSSTNCKKDISLSCKDYIDLVNVSAKEVESVSGAIFGGGYIIDSDKCEIKLVGECKLDSTYIPKTCTDFVEDVKVNFNIETDEGIDFEKSVNINKENCEIIIDGKSKIKPTPTMTVTSTPTVTITYTPTPTPTVTVPEPKVSPTPTPEPECEFYTGIIKDTNDNGGGIEKIAKDIVKYGETTGNLSCLTDKINEAFEAKDNSHWCNIYNENKYSSSKGYYDDCIVATFRKKVFGHADLITTTFYLDQQCNLISKPENGEGCGTFTIAYYLSPISLIFDEDLDINTDVAFVNFDLDPSIQDSWYTWKASNKAPLLVYDPEHTGKINSAYQLFGDWTFGGKQSASLPLQENYTPSSKWENGFEALASLDRDFDGKLSGEELNELALWFDGNRDAISQEGEVMSLADAGVTVLYFNGYKKDANGDLRLDLGYERKLGNEVIQGASIDWYGKGADSKIAIVEGYSSTFTNTKPNLGKESKPNQKADSNRTNKGNIDQIDASEFRGVWDFFIDGEAKYVTPDGYLILGEGKEVNSIEGHSIVERFFSKSPGNKYHSLVGMFELSGKVGYSSEKEKIINFKIKNENLTNNTIAMLSNDKKNLIGTTTIVLDGGIKVGTYSWRAIRHEADVK